MSEVLRDTSHLTPIEIALGIDEDGRTTAKKLYEFLELGISHYAKWFKRNILENDFAEENTDYWVFAPQGENLYGGRPTQDAKLTASFAKKISMTQKNQKGEAARNYFVGVEDGAKKLIEQAAYPIDAAILKGLAASGNLIRSTMKDEKAKPYEVAVVLDSLFRQSGVVIPECFIKVPEYEQISLQDFMQ